MALTLYFQLIIYGGRQLWITCKLLEKCLKMSGSHWYHQGTSDKSFPGSSHDFMVGSDQEQRWQRNGH